MDFVSFIDYCNKHIKGDEKGEAQIFLDRFFVALGYPEGIKGAGAECEYRIRNLKKKSTSFGDLVWKNRVLIEMKKRDEDLSNHLQQASKYWIELASERPRYIILCNFDEFWIYDFNLNVWEPIAKIQLVNLNDHKESFSFLLATPRTPVFLHDFEDVTTQAAEKIAAVFKSMINRGLNREDSLQYCLQCIVSMFAEDVELLPNKIFSRLVNECYDTKISSYDLIGGLFREMNTVGITPAGKYEGVDYFNGGLFEKVLPIELREYEIEMLQIACKKNWRNVNPAIFGTIFEKSLEGIERHKLGAHYTHEIDIKKIVGPVIVDPWSEKIENAEMLDDLYSLLADLTSFKVLDPACGSGNFLFVAFKELKLIEKRVLSEIRSQSTKRDDAKRLISFLSAYKFVTTNQFFGLDIKPFAVELAKVTLMVAKEISWFETKEDFDNKVKPLPLDNLDKNIVCTDALLDIDGSERNWPEVDVIIGNPPYQSKNKMQKEFGAEYVDTLRKAFPEVPGRADFCVYWFYKAHKTLKSNCYAGLVGTNTIRQNYSREGSLDYIVKNNGTIINAISSEEWEGDAVVHVSIVSWKKGNFDGNKYLFISDAKGKQTAVKVNEINSSLSIEIDVTSAKELKCNYDPKTCFQGQTHGYKGFLVSSNSAKALIKKNKTYSKYLFPFLIGDDLLGNINSQPSRYAIDFSFEVDILNVQKQKELYAIIKEKVLPFVEESADKEKRGLTKKNGRVEHLNTWWQFWRRREDMLNGIAKINRYVSCSRVTKRPIFEFVSSDIHPNDALMVFALEDDYSFGIIQSSLHWAWYVEKCSTMKGDPRYTANTVWDTFPWPQNLTLKSIKNVVEAVREFRNTRNTILNEHSMTLRELYRLSEQPGKNPLKDLQDKLDKAVFAAYEFDSKKDSLQQLLDLNSKVSEDEIAKKPVNGPGLPVWVKDKSDFITSDCVREGLED